jgi:hypothetical protein
MGKNDFAEAVTCGVLMFLFIGRDSSSIIVFGGGDPSELPDVGL